MIALAARPSARRKPMNGLNSLDKTGREYLLAAIDDLIRFCTSKVKVTVNLSM